MDLYADLSAGMIGDMTLDALDIVLLALLWLTLLVLALLFMAGATRKPTPQSEMSPDVLVRSLTESICGAVVGSSGQVAEAVSKAISAALAPAPVSGAEETLRRMQHEMSEMVATADVDDSDPFDSVIPRNREDAVFVSRDDPSPMGVSGLRFPSADASDGE